MKKKFILGFAFITLNFFSNAQVFILGGKGMLNGTWLLNDNVNFGLAKADKEFTFGMQGGAYLRYYFNEATYYSNTNVSLAIELMFNNYGQKYKGNYSDGTSGYSFTSKVSVSSLDIPIMVHIRGQAGLYGEFGVSFGMINGVKMDYSQDPSDTIFSNFSGKSVDESFSKNNFSGIFGFGIDSELSETLLMTTGFRLTYGFTDLTEPQKNNYPDYMATHSASIGFVLGFAYIINFYHDHH
ncbi:MAG: hypothetical protein JJE25_11105 [Bacteroidia bacterium]|nr:hypothetical protein [Bacteroidia bacterium]